ncbi:hypothetical protein M409DRAFT_64764 [Zasmidium cellare ATCC 36951]|uniref:CUE domain-containing protein n=1 Tax=Zasmidium cellare ATCC 36951 TaxID=1080233 RepID=A0A6A6CRE7_ZASCE|nr:uncharacterized protein M409DRAFT_64764 [Zasmidium cellare ATCC 36951]KAF2169734.1 hypothetical protein M409DRAFT_64764 [Zasmidium cellare ATCC 36951]
MSLPPFAPIPPATVRISLGPEEWEACLDAWLTLSEMALRVTVSEINSITGIDGSLSTYLVSFYSEISDLKQSDATLRNAKTVSILKVNFRLVKRIWIESDAVPPSLLSFDVLSKFCHAHTRVPDLPVTQQLLSELWKRRSSAFTLVLQKQKDAMILSLDSKNTDSVMKPLTQLAPLMHMSFDISAFFMTGSDFIDSLNSAYDRSPIDDQRKAISMIVYLGLLSLVKTEPPTLSLLSDHLYSLKSSAEKSPGSLLLADVISNSQLVSKVRQSLSGRAPDRLSKLLDSLDTYRTPSLTRPKKRKRRAASRAKGKQKQQQPDAALHMHRMSLVTQIQDLFPDLGSGFVLKLLDEYNDDVEQATAHLLEDSLPPHLASLDRTEQAPVHDNDWQTEVDHLAPKPTPPLTASFVPERRNVFDDDELDQLQLGTSRLHIGKQDRNEDAEQQPNKAAILSALAAFDSDDDERDDTYDVEDVGGTVDNAHPDGEPGPAARISQEENDMALFTAYKSSPELFGRTFDVRRGQARQALKAETGMTDEAIEGWAIMLQRDPKRLKRLEAQTGAFDGRQTELASTSYRESPGGTETEDSDAPQGSRGGFHGRGRGRGGRGRGRGGNVAGESNDPATAQAQRRKEANKSSRANHNRRDQRARKMARGGFPG